MIILQVQVAYSCQQGTNSDAHVTTPLRHEADGYHSVSWCIGGCSIAGETQSFSMNAMIDKHCPVCRMSAE